MFTSAATQHQMTRDAKVFYQALLLAGCYKPTPAENRRQLSQEKTHEAEGKENLLHCSPCFCKATNIPIKKPV